jgi:hypothetical protein
MKRRGVAVSIHADDEFNLRLALEHELDDVMPRAGLANEIIARHRRAIRRRVAGAVGLVVVIAGIGIPLSLSRPGGSRPAHPRADGALDHPVTLRLVPYTLTLTGDYRPAGPAKVTCAIAVPAGESKTAAAKTAAAEAGAAKTGAAKTGAAKTGAAEAAAVTRSGDCVFMLLTASFLPREPGRQGDPYIPRSAREVNAGRYQGWLIPRPRDGAALVIERPEAGGRLRDLTISSTGLSPAALVSLVSSNLS